MEEYFMMNELSPNNAERANKRRNSPGINNLTLTCAVFPLDSQSTRPGRVAAGLIIFGYVHIINPIRPKGRSEWHGGTNDDDDDYDDDYGPSKWKSVAAALRRLFPFRTKSDKREGSGTSGSRLLNPIERSIDRLT